ncbi:hypothetical protein [Parabacteroides sp. FAFU027]|uniref:hypothetical protein n=1 Tax=Parabacteroides sp. FAFU027 TaxID=2922715 RepID=UPI001FB02DC5|nr:hypothetical protein [Parabacteroides sp. FAFU027]
MLERILKSVITKPFCIILSVMFLAVTFNLSAENVKLSAGTSVPLETVNTIDADNLADGQVIDFRVMSDVKVGNQVVIKAGSIAKGQVLSYKKSGMIGQPGQLQIQIRSVKSVDGQEVFLAGGNINKEGDSKLVLSIALSLLLCPLFLLMKGKSAVIPAGMQVTSSVASDVNISL